MSWQRSFMAPTDASRRPQDCGRLEVSGPVQGSYISHDRSRANEPWEVIMPQTHVPPVSAAVPRRAPTVSRRHFLRGAFALATASLVTPTRGHLARAQVRFTGYPFTLGASAARERGVLDTTRA